MNNSNKSRETIISEKIEKSLQEWKLPPSSASDVFEPSGSFCCIPDFRVKTLEREIPLAEGYASFPLFSGHLKRANQIFYNFLRVGMIQVGLKPAKLGSNMSAVVCLRDNRLVKFYDSILGMVESSLDDGPIYFSYFPNHPVHLSDSSDAFCIDVKIQGNEKLTLVYRVHYKVMKEISIFNDLSSRHHVDEKGVTTLFVTDIAQSNRVVSKKISWDEIMIGEEGLVDENNLPSSSSSRGAVGNANVDWKETAEAHVLKVDVPGFKKEEVRVEVEAGGILQISGERRDRDDDDESDKWHCVERSSGKFLRRVRLPENAKLDEVKAAVENGVLTVTVPKEEVNKKRQVVKVIDISG